jgi:peptidoglycan/xylan/chitin deacetylase (PgdA/CDA1 family)
LEPTPTSTPEPTATPVLPLNLIPPIPTAERQSLVWKAGDVITIGPSDGTIYLSFDDCYGDPLVMKTVIETAHNLGARITFFCIGTAINNPQQAENMKLAISYGDEIENHTFDHAEMTTTDVKFMENEIIAQLAIVRNDLGDPNYKEYLIRPPFGRGAYNPYFQQAAAAEGLRIVTWTVSSGGTDDAYTTTPARIQRIMDSVNSSLLDKYGHLAGGTIILQHVRPADEAALATLIKEIQDKGGTFGLLGELVGRPNGTAVRINVMPQLVAYYPEIPARKENTD